MNLQSSLFMSNYHKLARSNARILLFPVIILLFAILLVGCTGSSGPRMNASGVSGDAREVTIPSVPAGSDGTSGRTTDIPASGRRGTSTDETQTLTQIAAACYTNCQITTGLTRGLCKAGCTITWAKNARDASLCDLMYGNEDLGAQQQQHYYGCLGVVAGVLNSTAPCNNMADRDQKNVCISTAAQNAANPSLCGEIQAGTPPEGGDASRYYNSYNQIIQDCQASARTGG